MTRCIKKGVNLKSSVYNQTGQNYYEQLAAYNSMSSHLRRVFLARSVIDSRNKNYLKRNQGCKVQKTDSEICLHLEATDDVIDKLAYDTQHHPMDILRIDLNAKQLNCCNYNLDHQLRVCSSQTYFEGTDQMNQQQRSKNQRIMSPTTVCSSKRKKILVSNFICKKEPKSLRDIPYIVGPSTCFSRQRKCRYEKEFSVPCTATRLDSTIFKSRSQSPRQKMIDHCSVYSNASQCCDFDCDEKSERLISKQFSCQKEEKKYVKFVYDITKEIMQRGLYTDKELQDVFKKHINQYKGILDMNKMLYEVYQLKISLNIADDSDIDEELEDLIHAQKLLSLSEIRPPTPPKILDDNKVMEKLESYQKMMKTKKSIDTKSVMLVDANPKLLLTERDVLISLVEAGVDPKRVQYICKNLRYKSRDVDFIETAQIVTKTLSSSDLKIDNLELENNDKEVSVEIETASANDKEVSVEIETASANDKEVSVETETASANDKEVSVETETASANDKEVSVEIETASANDKEVSVEIETASANDKEVSVEIETASANDKEVSVEIETVSANDKEVSVEIETASANDKKVSVEIETESANDKEVSVEIETESAHDNSVTDNSVESSVKQEANSSTSNLISMQDETTDTKEETESEITSEHKTES